MSEEYVQPPGEPSYRPVPQVIHRVGRFTVVDVLNGLEFEVRDMRDQSVLRTVPLDRDDAVRIAGEYAELARTRIEQGLIPTRPAWVQSEVEGARPRPLESEWLYGPPGAYRALLRRHARTVLWVGAVLLACGLAIGVVTLLASVGSGVLPALVTVAMAFLGTMVTVLTTLMRMSRSSPESRAELDSWGSLNQRMSEHVDVLTNRIAEYERTKQEHERLSAEQVQLIERLRAEGFPGSAAPTYEQP